MIAKDPQGREVAIPSAVVTQPAPNANYLKTSRELLPVNFEWTRINIEGDERLRLEIAGDRFFLGDVQVIETAANRAQAAFDTGLWRWRLRFGNVILSTGQFNVTDGSGPALLSPVMNSVFRYSGELPQLRFQWAGRPGASHYNLEVCQSPDFTAPVIKRQLAAVSFIQSELGQGTWYWRVQPVFPSAYEGSAGFSAVASFRLEEVALPQEPLAGGAAGRMPEIEIPESVIENIIAAAAASAQQYEPAITPQFIITAEPSPAQQFVTTQPASQPALQHASHEFASVSESAAVITQPVTTPAATPQPAAAQESAAVPQPVTAPERRLYTVRPGDTLIKIAGQFYGNSSWRIIFEANDNIEHPDLIHVGQVFVIP